MSNAPGSQEGSGKLVTSTELPVVRAPCLRISTSGPFYTWQIFVQPLSTLRQSSQDCLPRIRVPGCPWMGPGFCTFSIPHRPPALDLP